mmetsp:Transcript_15121/g.34852  ORF Transcript_15121/g.34852 Transcript_15121/m.34852 type:complete len:112 (-) Transcript_15121:224-559(-)
MRRTKNQRSKVLIRNDSVQWQLQPRKKGPFRIIQVHSNGTVKLQISPLVTETVNIQKLTPYKQADKNRRISKEDSIVGNPTQASPENSTEQSDDHSVSSNASESSTNPTYD